MFERLFGRKKAAVEPYDKTLQRPVIRSSICTGEKVAGFKDLKTGKFYDIMLIRDDKDMEEFLTKYAVDPEDISREF